MTKYTVDVLYSQTFTFDTADLADCTDDGFPPCIDLDDPDVIRDYLLGLGAEELIDISDQYPSTINKVTVRKME